MPTSRPKASRSSSTARYASRRSSSKNREDGFYQPALVANHPSSDVPFTRIVEYKHVPNQPTNVKQGQVKGTRIAKEYSSAEGDPYLPRAEPGKRARCTNVTDSWPRRSRTSVSSAGWRPKYFNMDQAILNVWRCSTRSGSPGKLQPEAKARDFGPGDGPGQVPLL